MTSVDTKPDSGIDSYKRKANAVKKMQALREAGYFVSVRDELGEFVVYYSQTERDPGSGVPDIEPRDIR